MSKEGTLAANGRAMVQRAIAMQQHRLPLNELQLALALATLEELEGTALEEGEAVVVGQTDESNPAQYCSLHNTAACTILQPIQYCSLHNTAACTILQPAQYCSLHNTAACTVACTVISFAVAIRLIQRRASVTASM